MVKQLRACPMVLLELALRVVLHHGLMSSSMASDSEPDRGLAVPAWGPVRASLSPHFQLDALVPVSVRELASGPQVKWCAYPPAWGRWALELQVLARQRELWAVPEPSAQQGPEP